ncbi:mRNA transport regulator 3 [Coprinopsis cinerea okayama7|uniref:mRNA transport regulator 3 n=1 Tax=Coprinopsis cinerea (strain Okayama-7 / 130 / ATCC MYA-4618 / FGSC 9003) TaxID=240176 RepID=A8NF62_COPC7|nr:mRNA transport regulator 3 [Coprinopsis cinerea okayama7\|eukprot:XP_001833208.2 mRNA transport regulator 3 [Coprinopsis cinerea okayama7\
MAQSGFDRRRINGPEESFAPVFEDDEDDSGRWKPGMSRQDRLPLAIRPIFLQPGLIEQANGSAYIETGKTKIACAIYGPRQSKNVAFHDKGRLNVELKFAPFSCPKRRAPIRDAEDRSIAMAIHQAILPSVRLETLPKSTVDVFITVLEEDGIEGCVAAGSVAASAALVDAGIEVFGIVASTSAAVIGEEIWLDPSEQESSQSKGTFVLATMPALNTITSIWQNGEMAPDQVLKAMEICEKQCVDIHTVVAERLRETLQ